MWSVDHQMPEPPLMRNQPGTFGNNRQDTIIAELQAQIREMQNQRTTISSQPEIRTQTQQRPVVPSVDDLAQQMQQLTINVV